MMNNFIKLLNLIIFIIYYLLMMYIFSMEDIGRHSDIAAMLKMQYINFCTTYFSHKCLMLNQNWRYKIIPTLKVCWYVNFERTLYMKKIANAESFPIVQREINRFALHLCTYCGCKISTHCFITDNIVYLQVVRK